MFNIFPAIPDAPPPFPAVNDRNVAHWTDEGNHLLHQGVTLLGLPPVLDVDGIRKLVHYLVTGGVKMLRGLTKLLVDGAVGLAGWFKSFLSDLVPRQFAAGLAALGIGAAPQPAVVDQVNRQAGFLARFRDEVANAEQLLDGTAVARAGQYAHAVWGLGANVFRYRMLLLGRTMERGVLGIADHCNGCLERSAKGWVPIGTLKPIGATECRALCHCHFEFQ